ncbi:MAG: hypothetical protein M0D57_13690 [Sphingobacteriales bacterium JAD_PAG50586_3]|nr:MAG: hypothetical protein M0D57_13690 [Sphingobacteriales bacterium JAD_PAG50586_3]
MKKTIIFLVLLSAFVSCRSLNYTEQQGKKIPLSNKLLTLEKQIGDITGPNYTYNHSYSYPNSYMNSIGLNGDELRIINNEVDENLTDPYGDKYGYIEFNRRTVNMRYGIGWTLLSSMTFFTVNLLGVPFMNLRLDSEVEIRILDVNRKLIAKYSAVGQSKFIIAMYYGYGLMAATKVYPQALIDALDKIRPQINADVDRVNKLLKAAKDAKK